jgi:hypothetical protein
MDVRHWIKKTDDCESDSHRERIMALYERAEMAQQHAKGTQMSAEVRTSFAQQANATFGACIEVQSASDVSMWERSRVAGIADLPVVGGSYRYESGDTKTVLYVIVERARARILTE